MRIFPAQRFCKPTSYSGMQTIYEGHLFIVELKFLNHQCICTAKESEQIRKRPELVPFEDKSERYCSTHSNYSDDCVNHRQKYSTGAILGNNF